MLTPRLRYQNVRADVPDILQKSLRDEEVVGLNWPRGRFVRQRRGIGSLLSVLDSSTPFRPAVAEL